MLRLNCTVDDIWQNSAIKPTPVLLVPPIHFGTTLSYPPYQTVYQKFSEWLMMNVCASRSIWTRR